MEAEKKPPQGTKPTYEQLEEMLRTANQINYERSRSLFGKIADALGATCLAAESGNDGAKQDLRMFMAHLERMKSSVHGIARG